VADEPDPAADLLRDAGDEEPAAPAGEGESSGERR
jgi:hypothetical protein